MKATECLNTEHGVFLTQLSMLESLLKEGASREVLRAATLTIAASVEKHRAVEEKLLYPAIVRAFGEGFPPIRVMETEHARIQLLEALAEDVAQSDTGDAPLLLGEPATSS